MRFIGFVFSALRLIVPKEFNQRLQIMAESSAGSDAESGGHHVYILRCADGTYYTGYTTDVERRVAEHNAGEGAKYTRGRSPVELVHVETFDTQSGAMQREHAIKQLRRSAKEQLVRTAPEP